MSRNPPAPMPRVIDVVCAFQPAGREASSQPPQRAARPREIERPNVDLASGYTLASSGQEAGAHKLPFFALEVMRYTFDVEEVPVSDVVCGGVAPEGPTAECKRAL